MKMIALAAGVLALLMPDAARPAPDPANEAAPLAIVAAENFYGDIARQLAGPAARITAIMSNPDQDPHLYEASPSAARAIAAARIVIMNGADYDPWMLKLLGAAPSAARQVIVVADLAGRKAGDNPHLWYDTANVAACAKAVTSALVAADQGHQATYARRLDGFLGSLTPLDGKVAALRTRFAGTPVTATEPVFGYMASALGLSMRNERFQLATMNDTEPSASDVAAFETDLRNHRVRVLLYNSQATGNAAQRLLRLAHQARVPVVGVTETEPAGKTYQQWMTDQLDTLETALSKPSS